MQSGDIYLWCRNSVFSAFSLLYDNRLDHNYLRFIYTMHIWFIFFVFLLGCSETPRQDELKDALIQHFQSRDYKVVEIDISAVREMPLGQREYMAPKKYIVDIARISLQNSRLQEGHGTEKLLSFNDASITLKSAGSHGQWIVDTITGIPLL